MEFESKVKLSCPQSIREHSLHFDSSVFKERIADFVRIAIEDFRTHSGATKPSFHCAETLLADFCGLVEREELLKSHKFQKESEIPTAVRVGFGCID